MPNHYLNQCWFNLALMSIATEFTGVILSVFWGFIRKTHLKLNFIRKMEGIVCRPQCKRDVPYMLFLYKILLAGQFSTRPAQNVLALVSGQTFKFPSLTLFNIRNLNPYSLGSHYHHINCSDLIWMKEYQLYHSLHGWPAGFWQPILIIRCWSGQTICFFFFLCVYIPTQPQTSLLKISYGHYRKKGCCPQGICI